MTPLNLYIDFKVPSGWHELTDEQLSLVCLLISSDLTASEIAATCLLLWNNTQVLCKQPCPLYQ